MLNVMMFPSVSCVFFISSRTLSVSSSSLQTSQAFITVLKTESGVKPSVVSYTTAIAACAASEQKQPKRAYEWIKRMRIMGVKPNAITYNTALSACLDGKLESTELASVMAKEMLEQVEEQIISESSDDDAESRKKPKDEYTDVIPDYTTRIVARKMMQQLKENWVNGDIEKKLATSTIRPPLLDLSTFSTLAKIEQYKAKKQQQIQEQQDDNRDLDDILSTQQMERELDYTDAARRVAEI